jgi:hypothetical protein
MLATTPGKSGELLIVVRTQGMRPMKIFEFSVIASGLDPSADDFESRFYDAGCTDATVSFQRGHIIIDFARAAKSADEAISSAIENVRSAGATVDRVEPDPLVSLSEIAARSGLTTAAISLYASGQRSADFPAPVAKVTSRNPLWIWASVASWLFARDKLGAQAVAEAEAVVRANQQLGRRSAA